MVNDELTYKIIGCAMNVHNTLGAGFQEVIYQRCLAIELGQAGLEFVREVAYDFPKGLLINFGGRSLQYKLIFNPHYQNQDLQNFRMNRINE